MPTPRPSTARAVLGGLLILALGLRFALAILHPGIVQADEIFQYVEQAHRLVHGAGLVPWEYRLGIRSWIIPGALAPILAAGGGDPVRAAAAIALAMSLLGLVPVLCAWRWGERAAGFPGALLAAGLNAVWFEAVHYSTHPLADTVAAVTLVAGVHLADTSRHPRAAGFLLGLTACVRPQLLPALLACLPLLPRKPALLAGAAIALAGAGLLDALTLGLPWQSIWLYARVNLQGAADSMGVQPATAYLAWMLRNWGYAAALLAGTALAGAAARPLLAIPPLVLLLTFAAIGHKEERFLLPALPFLLTLAGIGSARLLARLPVPPLLALAAWATLSAGLARRDAFTRILDHGAGMLHAMRLVSDDPAACGLAVAPAAAWPFTGGYAHLRPGMALYGLGPNPPAAAYNAIIAPAGPSFAAIGYAPAGCWINDWPGRAWHQACLWRRPGPCDPATAEPLAAGIPAALRPLFPPSR